MSAIEGDRVDATSVAQPIAASVRHVLQRIGVVETRVRAEVQRRRKGSATADDPYLGLYLSDERVDEVLGGVRATPSEATFPSVVQVQVEGEADAAEAAGHDLRLRRLARTFGLDDTDVAILLAAAAPDIDLRFEALYGYLNDDVSRRHASVQLALLLADLDPASAAARARLGAEGALVRGHVIEVEDGDRPVLSRSVRVADRVLGHLLGDDTLDPRVEALRVPAVPSWTATVGPLTRALADGDRLVHVRDVEHAGGESAAVAAFADLGRDAIVLDVARLDTDVQATATAAALEARLTGAGLVVGPLEALADLGSAAVRAFAEVPGGCVLVGVGAWDPSWSRVVPLAVSAARASVEERDRLWAQALGEDRPADIDMVEATASFRLTPLQMHRAAAAARQLAAAAGRPITRDDLQRGVRAQNAAGLQRLARRIEPRVGWQDLVVPPRVEKQLRELPMRWRHRDRVLEDWGMGRGVATGRGVSALFAGGSGTGKTLAAEVIAADLGLDLYLVDLSTVVDKYIGETSKNLERIFDEADRVNGVLLFDEADALFGKRSAVSDAKDRHANVEVAFLLQRMETFDGVAILTTNLAANLDDAFLRRLDSIVDFPAPDEHLRRTVWQAKLGGGVPCADDVDVHELAELFTLSGSEISNVVVSAAYHAAERGEDVRMRDLVDAAIREHRKIGRHLTAADLGAHADALGADR